MADTQASIEADAGTAFFNLRRALGAAADFYLWISTQADADLVALGFTATRVTQLKTAAADAHKLSDLYNGGTLGTYTLPYNFSSSQRIIIGSQT